ncbi:hypothetical protein ACIQK6_22755 [Streptomyces sp. NPDC091682]|uniref:hypothetical protein n=1 Tax=Streptomyces sp. NPDC091682 TaxID=3366005 RepID=UPI0037F2B948
MQADETGEPGRVVTAESLLDAAVQAFLQAEFNIVQPILQRLRHEFGVPDIGPAAVRHDTLLAALAARVGNWPDVLRRCPDFDLVEADTGIVHALAVMALRELAQEGRHTDARTAAVVIVLWAYLLDEEDPDDFRALLTERRGEPVPDAVWEQALAQLRGRVGELLRALDVRAGRDVLSAWSTAWEAECEGGAVFFAGLPTDAGPDALTTLGEAAGYLVRNGRGAELLTAYEARHPDSMPADLPGHDACAVPLARALAGRGRDLARADKWSEALADLDAAVWLGHTLRNDERAAVLQAGKNVGRSRTGRDYSPRVRIAGLERAHSLLPQDTSLADELTAELVAEGKRVERSDPRESRSRFARALAVTPTHPEARAGLDSHLTADLEKAIKGAHAGDALLVDEVRGLLARDPECMPARLWLENHHAERAVTAAAHGRTDEARGAVREMFRYDGPEGSPSEGLVDDRLVGILVTAARNTRIEDARAGLERRVRLLHTAASVPSRTLSHVREDLNEALLHLAEHLEDAASPSDVIELFLRDLMRTGASARFDQIVEAAYRNRARARETAGDPGGALRDRTCAERVGAGLPAQGHLFGPASVRPPRRDADTGQDTLF